jgi:tetratricopeptide (TPR) repeat protein
MTQRFCLLCTILLTLFGFSSCQPDKNQDQEGDSHLGTLVFEVTGSEEAQPKFTEGMLLLHSFEYEDAGEAFQQTIAIDSNFVMAYWGKAMSLNHALWQEQDFDQGNEVLNELDTTAEGRVAKAVTPLEKDFIEAINILYGEGNKATRDSSYCMFMESLYNKYPGNDEVATFYSLSLIGWGTTDRDKKHIEKAAEIAIEVLERNPQHPGALHYTIHAYDDPQYAELALDIADKYAGVAPDAGHALHMPTHTYLALGKWDKVVSSNIVSWEAEKARKERKGLDNNALGYHAYHWLQYGRLQLGDKETSRLMVDSMKNYCEALPSPRARAHMVLLKTTYVAGTNDYTSGVPDIEVELKDLNLVTRAKNYFISGMAAYHQENAAELDSVILRLAKERVIEDLKISGTGVRMCGNINRSATTKTDLLEAETMELQLRAMRAWLDKDAKTTEALLLKATELHAEAGYSYGPPSIVKPSFEMYGEWLLENNRPKEALVQFEKSLEYAPNKTLSVEGKEAAMKLM